MFPLVLVKQNSLDNALNSMLSDFFNMTEIENTSGFKLKDNIYAYSIPMPGFEPSHLDLEIAEGKLFIKAENKEEGEEQNLEYALALPKDGHFESLDASLKNGLLKIKLPRREEAKPKKIPVN